jgi:hypothetical protein
MMLGQPGQQRLKAGAAATIAMEDEDMRHGRGIRKSFLTINPDLKALVCKKKPLSTDDSAPSFDSEMAQAYDPEKQKSPFYPSSTLTPTKKATPENQEWPKNFFERVISLRSGL